MDFEYNKKELWQGSIDVPRLGQCAIEGINSEGLYFYFICTTQLGWTTICTFGPVVPDCDMIVDTFTWSKIGLEYKEDRISKAIKRWLNNPSTNIEKAKIIEIEEAVSYIPDIKSYLKDYKGDEE